MSEQVAINRHCLQWDQERVGGRTCARRVCEYMPASLNMSIKYMLTRWGNIFIHQPTERSVRRLLFLRYSYILQPHIRHESELLQENFSIRYSKRVVSQLKLHIHLHTLTPLIPSHFAHSIALRRRRRYHTATAQKVPINNLRSERAALHEPQPHCAAAT